MAILRQFRIVPMILRSIALLLTASTCLAQTTGAVTECKSPNEIATMKAQANQGNADAQLKLGDAYLRGRGVAQNNAEAVRLFREAADKGNADAQYALGSLYAAGIGV